MHLCLGCWGKPSSSNFGVLVATSFQGKATQRNATQSKAKQSQAKQNRAKQNNVKQITATHNQQKETHLIGFALASL